MLIHMWSTVCVTQAPVGICMCLMINKTFWLLDIKYNNGKFYLCYKMM